MSGALAPLGWGTVFGTWELRPVWTLVLLAAAAAYAVGVRAAARRGEAVHPVRAVCFGVALVLLWVTVSSSVSVYGMRLFWMHMVGHLLLIMVVPAFLVLGRPLAVLRAATAGRSRAQVDAVLGSSVVDVLTLPLVGFGVYAVVIVGTHLTGFMDAMMTRSWLMPGEEVLYVAAGWLLMLGVIGGEPVGRTLDRTLPAAQRLFLSVVAMVPDTVVGIVLLQSSVDMFPAMAASRPAWGPTAVHDMNIGGALMWALGDGLMMLVSVGLIVALISDPARDRMLGSWLDGARNQALREAVTRHEAPTAPTAPTDGTARPRADVVTSSADVDDDDEVLSAYNRMLARLDDGTH